MQKFGKVPNMRKLHIRIFLTCLYSAFISQNENVNLHSYSSSKFSQMRAVSTHVDGSSTWNLQQRKHLHNSSHSTSNSGRLLITFHFSEYRIQCIRGFGDDVPFYIFKNTLYIFYILYFTLHYITCYKVIS